MGSILGGGGGAGKAAGAQVAANEKAIEYQKQSLKQQLELGRESLALQKEMFDQAMAYGEPYRDAGGVALAQYESLLYGIPIAQTASYQKFASDEQAKGASRDDIFNQLKDQYTTRQGGGSDSETLTVGLPTGDVYTVGGNMTGDASNAFFSKLTARGGDFGPGAQAARDITALEQMRHSGASMEDMIKTAKASGLSVLSGYEPSRSVTDYDALNAAVDERLRQQEEGALSARDQAFQGMDVSQVADWQRTPSYDFRMDEGQKALERSAAARSGALSGAAIKASQRFGQDIASSEFDNYLRRVGGVVDMGAGMSGSAAQGALSSGATQGGILSGMSNAVGNTYSNIASLQSGIGAAQASGYLAKQSSGAGFLNTLAGIAGGIGRGITAYNSATATSGLGPVPAALY